MSEYSARFDEGRFDQSWFNRIFDSYLTNILLSRLGIGEFDLNTLLLKSAVRKCPIDSFLLTRAIPRDYNLGITTSKSKLEEFTFDISLQERHILEYLLNTVVSALGGLKTAEFDALIMELSKTAKYDFDSLIRKLYLSLDCSVDVLSSKIDVDKKYIVDILLSEIKKSINIKIDSLLSSLNISADIFIDTLLERSLVSKHQLDVLLTILHAKELSLSSSLDVVLFRHLFIDSVNTAKSSLFEVDTSAEPMFNVSSSYVAAS